MFFIVNMKNSVSGCSRMGEKSLIFGVSDAIEDLIISMVKQNVELDLENDYYLNISPPPIPESSEYFGDSVISGIFVDLTENLIKKIIVWLQAKKTLKNPKIKFVIDGSLLNITVHDLEILLQVLAECSKHKRNVNTE